MWNTSLWPWKASRIAITAAASAAAHAGMCVCSYSVLRAWYCAGISTDAGAWVSWAALVVGSLAGRTAEVGCLAHTLWCRFCRAACKSANDQGHEAKRSVGPGDGLEVRGGCWLWRANGLETSGSRPPTKTAACAVGRRPPGPGPERTKGVSAAPALMRERTVHANRHCQPNRSTRLCR